MLSNKLKCLHYFYAEMLSLKNLPVFALVFKYYANLYD